jgi:hypothetical protein
MSEELNPAEVSEQPTPSSGLLLSVEPLQPGQPLRATDTDSDTDSSDTSDSLTDSDSSDASDSDGSDSLGSDGLGRHRCPVGRRLGRLGRWRFGRV